MAVFQNNLREQRIREMFLALYRAWGHQGWWPAESRFEMIVGAYLTQNTAWTNVERAMEQLRQARVLSLDGIRRIPLAELEQLIRSAGYFRQKAQRLKNFVAYLDEKYGGSLDRLFACPTAQLRDELLSLNGVGPETADSILLYAGQHEIFVVDAYTRRIFDRHQIVGEKRKYDEIRQLFERALGEPGFLKQVSDIALNVEAGVGAKPAGSHHAPSRMSSAKRSPVAQVYNEMHGLIVGVGKNYCQKSRVLCEECPLGACVPKPVRLPRKRKKTPRK